MTTKADKEIMTATILTDDQVDTLLDGVLRASGSRLANYTSEKTLDELRSAVRDIEQAVLQSPDVQALRKDAERYKEIRNRLTGALYDPAFFDDLFTAGCMGHPEKVDEEIDASMEQQT